MGEQSNNGQSDQRTQRVARQRCAKALAAAAIAVTGMLLRAPAASADVTIGADWTPVSNSNGFTYYDGITNYSGNPLAQVDVNGNKWLQLDVSNAYWGQTTGQKWANAALAPDNFNNNPHLEFDLDLSQWHWGNADYKLELGNDGSGGVQGGQGGPNVTRQLGYLTVPLPSSSGNPFIQHVSMDLSSLLPRQTDGTYLDFMQYIEPRYWGYYDNTAQTWLDTGNNYSSQRVLMDNLRLTTDAVKTNGAWNLDADGTWSTPANWAGANFGDGSGGMPNGAGNTANILPVGHVYDVPNQRYGSEPTLGGHTITLDMPVTLGVLNIDNSNSYTLASSGGNGLTIQGAVGVPAAINVALGTHTISAPVTLASDTTVSVAAASALTLSGLQTSTGGLTKTGAGALSVNNVRGPALNVNEGSVSVLPGRSTSGTSKVGALSVGATASLDLNDQDLIVDYTGSSPLATIKSLIVSGYNNSSWNGSGIRSSSALTGFNGHSTALGYAEASAVGYASGGTFRGQPVDNTSVLVRYTLRGDADLNGSVDLTDFTFLAGNFNGTGKSWQQGDFNYDGSVDLTDFTFLAGNFNSSMPGDVGGVGAPVPEPASIAALTGLALVCVARRRSRGR